MSRDAFERVMGPVEEVLAQHIAEYSKLNAGVECGVVRHREAVCVRACVRVRACIALLLVACHFYISVGHSQKLCRSCGSSQRCASPGFSLQAI